ncbi:MAG: XRE family transcriptional regulator [Clostridia bacterium]|nr:XRE family transcriptional regulator [Clostridia bacterium]
MVAFGKRLAVVLKNNGMQQKELAEALGVSQALISKIVRGVRTPSEDIAFRIAQILGVSKEYLESDSVSEVLLDSTAECIARASHARMNADNESDKYYNSQVYDEYHAYERISYNRYEDIKRIAVGMYCKYDIPSVPVKPFKLAGNMGIDCVKYSSLSDNDRSVSMWISRDGYCRKGSTGKWSIFYNDEIESTGRIHYTIMHEIGHIVLHHNPEYPLAEREADFFAKYMLCPPAVLFRSNYRTVEDVVSNCGVSYEAASYALDYCKRWLAATGGNFAPYEEQLLKQLNILY